MERLVVVGAVALLVGGMGVTRLADMQDRIGRLDEFRRSSPRRTQTLESELAHVQAQLSQALSEIESTRQNGMRNEESLTERLRALETALTQANSQLESQGRELSSAVEGPARIDQRIGALEAGVESRWNGLENQLREALEVVEQTRSELGSLTEESDVEIRWNTIVGPTVQLAGETTVGSGTVLESTPRAGAGDESLGYETLLITAWHVVRDIIADSGKSAPPIPVAIYDDAGHPSNYTATLLFHEPGIDAAILRLDSDARIAHGARLASRAELRSRRIFHPIYAVGCPLGNDPIPTRGEIADLEHVVDGATYWMISAPTYIGNSGGGIFDERSGHLLGVFSKIYTHGAIRPTVVPHMGLASSLDRIYDWLELEGLASVVDEGDHARLVIH